MQSPKFSIIVPMYNVEKYIARALESAINQSFKDIEIICVDDCGQDKSIEIAKEFAKKDERIKIVQNERNLGTFAARNNGALSAKGEYLLFLDSDDFLHKDTCLKCYELLKTYKNQHSLACGEAQSAHEKYELDFIMFNLFSQDEKDGEFKLCQVANKTQIINTHAFEAMYFGKDTHFYNVATKCIKRQTYLKALDFANVTRKFTIAEDILASMALLGVSKHIALLDEGLYYYCYNGDSATKTTNPNKIQEILENLDFCTGKFEGFITHHYTQNQDEKYKTFMHFMIKLLAFHRVRNEVRPFEYAYQRHLEQGYAKWLARLIFSLQKKRFGYNQTKRELERFVKANKGVFEVLHKKQSLTLPCGTCSF